MSTTRLSFSAVLGTVQATANTVTGALDAAAAGVGMLNSFVTQAADNQRLRQLADKEDFLEDLIREKAQQRTESDVKIDKFTSKSSGHKAAYTSHYSRFEKLLRTPEDLEELNNHRAEHAAQ